jgi:hypothetical protein
MLVDSFTTGLCIAETAVADLMSSDSQFACSLSNKTTPAGLQSTKSQEEPSSIHLNAHQKTVCPIPCEENTSQRQACVNLLPRRF